MTMDGSSHDDNLAPDLARRLHGALTADREAIDGYLADASPEVARTLLKNPRLTERHLLELLQRHDVPEELLKAALKHPLVARSHPLKLALARHPKAPAPLLLTLLPQFHLFELVDFCFLSGVSQDPKLAAERELLKRLPTTPLANKTTLARRGTATVVGQLLKEGDSRLLEPCLDNPRLSEAAVFQFLNGPAASPDNISALARHRRWKDRPGVRLAILKQRKTPLIWFTLFLPTIPSTDLQNLLTASHLYASQKAAIEAELRSRGCGEPVHTSGE
jgi:hypothetical protein